METSVLGVSVHYAEHGAGIPLVALHGAGVDHRELEGALEPMLAGIPGIRRLYPDLPGMGRTIAPESVASNDDVLEVVLGFIDATIGGEPFLLLGHSYGGYLARAIAHRRPELTRGLALICPVGEFTDSVPQHEVLTSDPDLLRVLSDTDAETYRTYFVVQTAETLKRFRERVAVSSALVDEDALSRIFSRWEISGGPDESSGIEAPTLILAGRQDATAGFAGPARIAADYPRATVAVLDGVGHALLHENPSLAHALIMNWVGRSRS